MSDDYFTLAVLTALVLFSVGVTYLMLRRKPAVTLREAHAGDPAAGAGGADAEETTTKQAITVTFSKSEVQHPWDPEAESLLEFIESRGIEVESQCRAGECGSCRTKLVSGEVLYRQEPSVNPGRGHCLLCITLPKSDLTLAR
jgi:ferredoxin